VTHVILGTHFVFQPVAVESLGQMHESTRQFIVDLCHEIIRRHDQSPRISAVAVYIRLHIEIWLFLPQGRRITVPTALPASLCDDLLTLTSFCHQLKTSLAVHTLYQHACDLLYC